MTFRSRKSVGDLALFGGTPAFAEKLHVGRPNIGDRDELFRRVGDILDRRWLTNRGQQVEQFEERIARISGARHAIAVCNATVGLEIVTRALGLAGNAIVPAFTFVASAHALRWMGVDPRFVDVELDSHLIDAGSVEEQFTDRTSAIMGVHLWGKPCDVKSLAGIAAKRSVPVIYDAAHAFGCSVDGQPIGQFGDVTVFSFHATKFVNSFEGGAIVTNDDEIARQVRLLINFGFRGYDDVEAVGTNGKMNEVCAAMGLVSMDAMPDILKVNRRNYDQYSLELEGLPGVSLLPYESRHDPNYQYVVAMVDPVTASLHRDVLIDVLWAENVVARRYFYPGVHRMDPYRAGYPGAAMPVTDAIADRILILPTGTSVGGDAISTVSDIIRFALDRATELAERRSDQAHA